MSNPRLLLFGTPGAGKSSLLGALAQAATTQAPLLKGKLVSASTEFTDLRKDTYQAQLAATEDLTEYDICLEPEEGASLAATLLDCSGASAQAMLKSKQPFADSHPLKKQILDADGVLLIVDASLTGKQLGEEFQQFARWLTDFHETRGRRTDVGELPVYLVLTKCDMLAKANDTFAQWLQRIEEGKRRVDQKFRVYLKEHGTGFGSFAFNVWATAIKRPTLSDRQTKAEPFGVAELFRQCLRTAADYDARQTVSAGRLQNVVVGALATVALLALSVGLLALYQPETAHSTLTEDLEKLLPRADTKAAERLRGTIAVQEKKLEAIGKLEDEPGYKLLPSTTRDELNKHKVEIEEYLNYYRRERATLKLPARAKNDEEFAELEKKVRDFAFPPELAEEWKETPLGKRVQQLRDEFAAMNTEIDKEVAWLNAQSTINKTLAKAARSHLFQMESEDKEKQKLARPEAEKWNAEYQQHLTKQEKIRSRTPPRDFIPNVTGRRFESLSKFKRVQDAQKDWEKSKRGLEVDADRITSALKALAP